MTWDPNKPASTDSPSQAPAQIQTNWNRLQTIIQKDHQFNAAAATNDGYHKVVDWVSQGSSPAYSTSTAKTFVKNATQTLDFSSVTAPHLFHRSTNGAGTANRENPISPVPIRAYANWNGVSGAVIRSSYNISSITRMDEGEYTINFSAGALPSNAYTISLCGMRNSDNTIVGYVLGNATYGTIVTTTSIKIEFRSITGGNLRDVLMGSIIVYGG